MANAIISKIEKIGIVPVVVMKNAAEASKLAQALCQGGLPCAEVTFRTKDAADTIKEMKKSCPDMLVGAGTILTKEQVDQAIRAGAEFIVSPGFNPHIIEYCLKRNIIALPGIVTPSELALAIEYGLKYVKFFPAEASGGIPMIEAISAPYPEISFMPTGGINFQNAKAYLECKSVFACGGSWMVKKQLIEKQQYDEIELLARKASELVKTTRGEIGNE